jgi:hypothetical protein
MLQPETYDSIIVFVRVFGIFFDTTSILFPTDAFGRAGFDGFLDAVLGPAFRQDDLGFFFIFVKGENLLTEFNTTFTSDAFIFVDHDTFSHCLPPSGAVSGI